MRRCADAQMRRCADAQMRRCANAQMRKCADAQMRRCANVQMHIMCIYIQIQPLYHDNHVESALHETSCDVDVVASIIVTIKSDVIYKLDTNAT